MSRPGRPEIHRISIIMTITIQKSIYRGSMPKLLSLPGVGQTVVSAPGGPEILSAPSEQEFTAVFGSLLPPASYLSTPNGDVAYYRIHPTSPTIDGKRIFLIHGVQTPALGLLDLARVLATNDPSATIILYDHFGHGLTPTPVIPHTPSIFHDVITRLLDHLHWTSAHLVGYSFGGSLLAGYLCYWPERVDSATFVAPAGLLNSTDLDLHGQIMLCGETGEDIEEVRDWVFNEFLEGGALVVPEDWQERVNRGEVVAEAIRHWQLTHHDGYQASVIGIVRDASVFGYHLAFQHALEVGKPCLVILGAEDGVCSVKDVEDVGFKNIKVIENVGHAVVRERAEMVGQYIHDFIETIP